jgi:hypothetical protein
VIVRRLPIALLLVLVAAIGACQSDSSTSRTFEPENIAPLLLQDSEAPDGTEYVADASGPATVSELAQGDAELASGWEDLGFVGGTRAVFSSGADPATAAFAVVGNAGMVFPDAGAADEALELHRSVGVPSLTVGAEEVPIDQIGDEAFAFTFRYGPAPVAGAICAFRVGNAMFMVAGSGPSVTTAMLVAIAQTIAERATQ